ncbi:MAG: hypothetical protein Q9225_002208 [Loekoesia sp. 1 TL-2023]
MPRQVIAKAETSTSDLAGSMLLGSPDSVLTYGRDVNTTAQLDAGVRLLTAQVHNNNGAWHLCHTSCSLLDAGSLSSWLTEIKRWLDRNPHDVVTLLLVNSDNAAASDLDEEFAVAAIKPYAFTPALASAVPSSWPTLNDLITSGKRLITFVADVAPSSAAPYLLNEFTYVFENPFSVLSLSNFSCTPERPAVVQGQTSAAVQSGRLPLMNHFLNIEQIFGIQVPDIGNISVTNAISGPVGNLGDAATACTTAYGRAPSFILVDFFEQGSAIDTVDRLNGITPVGRVSAPRSGSQGVATSGALSQASNLGSALVSSYGFCTILLVLTLNLGMT